MKTRKVLILPVMILFTLFMVQCNNDDGFEMNKGEVNIEMTDAPADNADVKGTFITVADVKINGKSIDGFSKQTIEISAYHSGEVTMLAKHQLEAGTYNEISLVLDTEHDVHGNSPGSYVLTTDGQKHELNVESGSKLEISISKEFSIGYDSTTNLVLDFDLRKSIVADSTDSGEMQYGFVSETEMNNAVRIVDKEESGKIKGTVEGEFDSKSEVYVYLYRKGEFNILTETNGFGSSNVLFAHAVTSAKLQSDGSYILPFVEEGEYEIHVASYSNGLLGNRFHAMLNANASILGMLLNSINVFADATTEINIRISSNS